MDPLSAEFEAMQIKAPADVGATASASTRDSAPKYVKLKDDIPVAESWAEIVLGEANLEIHRRIMRSLSSNLCPFCARFDFKRRLRTFKRRENRESQYKLTRWESENAPWDLVVSIEEDAEPFVGPPRFKWRVDEKQTQDCQLCCIFMATAQDMRSENVGLTGSVRVSILHQRQLPESKRINNQCCTECDEGSNNVRFCVKIGSVTRTLCMYFSLDSDKAVAPLVDGEHVCIGRRHVSSHVDFDEVSRWIGACNDQHNHGGQASERLPWELPHFRVIDVQAKCVIRSTTELKYAALSYTWGDCEQYILTKARLGRLERHGSLMQQSSRLTNVVKDAIVVCERLSIPYLWIDSLCILQDDADQKHTQIESMDAIYSSAYITLIAGAGRDSNGGLPGVSVAFPMDTYQFEIEDIDIDTGNKTKYIITEEMTGPLDRSRWSTRGWTFQELALSSRALFFAPNEAYLSCTRGILNNSRCRSNGPQDSLPGDPSSKSICYMVGRVRTGADEIENYEWIDYVELMRQVYWMLLSEYLSRELSFEEDALHAFEGIQSAFLPCLGRTHKGLLLENFARRLLWDVGGHGIPGHGFPDAGNEATVRTVRRPKFPSWTWAGWQFLDVTSQPVLIGVGNFRPEAVIYSLDSDGSPYPLIPEDEMTGPRITSSDLCGIPLSNYKGPCTDLLVFWTECATFEVPYEPIGTPNKYGIGKFAVQPRRRVPQVTVEGVAVETSKEDSMSTVLLDIAWRRTQPEELDLVIVGLEGARSQRHLHSMVVEYSHGIAYRVAIPKLIHRSDWERRNPQRRLVVLG